MAFWGWDIAGFSGELPTVELFVRATAMAAFCPIMQYHSEFSGNIAASDGTRPPRDRTPWNIAELNADERALTLYRRFAVLRERLLAYLVEQADRSVANRVPMMRALCFGFPDDPEVWSHPLQYPFGDSLLVAPFCHEGDTGVDVYLPAGEWVDAWTGERHLGPAMFHRNVPWDKIALYIDAAAAPALQPLFAGLPDRLDRDPDDFHKRSRAPTHENAHRNAGGVA